MRLSFFSFTLGSDRVDVSDMVSKHYPEKLRALEKTGFEVVYRSAGNETVLTMATRALDGVERNWLSEADVVLGVSSESSSSPHWIHELNSVLPRSSSRRVFGLQDACTGFVGALELATAMIKSGNSKRVLIVNGDTYTKRIHDDPGLSMLFSDAVSVVGLDKSTVNPSGAGVCLPFEIIFSETRNLPVSHDHLGISDGSLHMDGAKVFQFASTLLPDMVRRSLEQSDLASADIDWYIHQGSRFVVSEVESILGAEQGALFRSALYGNTVGSSIPIQLSQVAPSKSYVGLVAFGMGLSARVLIARVVA